MGQLRGSVSGMQLALLSLCAARLPPAHSQQLPCDDLRLCTGLAARSTQALRICSDAAAVCMSLVSAWQLSMPAALQAGWFTTQAARIEPNHTVCPNRANSQVCVQDRMAQALHEAWQAWHASLAGSASESLEAWGLPSTAASLCHSSAATIVEHPLRCLQLRLAARSLARCAATGMQCCSPPVCPLHPAGDLVCVSKPRW